jgi:hypothetical protein
MRIRNLTLPTIFTFATLLLLSGPALAQKEAITDKLLQDICKSINERPEDSDSARVTSAFEKHLRPVLAKMNEKELEETYDLVFYRLQRLCLSFSNILTRNSPASKGDWQQVSEKPASVLKSDVCRELLSHKKLTYLEVTGDTVLMDIRDGFYTDRFVDGTWSKLKFKWIGDCEFEIEFIESTNESRKNFSRPGDKYRYQLLSKHESYYAVSVQSVGREGYMTFRIYF